MLLSSNKILRLTLPKKQGKIKKGSEKKCTVYICSFWLQSDLASLFCPCGFIIWGQPVSCPGTAWLVCSLFLSVSVFLVCFSVKPARVLPPSVWLAHQFWMNGACVPSHHQMSQMMLQPKSSGEGTPHVRLWGFPGGARGKSACQCRRLRDAGSISGSGRSPAGGHGNPLSILVWRIPWTEEPGGLEFIGSQRVRHDWSDLARTHTCELWAMCRGIES